MGRWMVNEMGSQRSSKSRTSLDNNPNKQLRVKWIQRRKTQMGSTSKKNSLRIKSVMDHTFYKDINKGYNSIMKRKLKGMTR